MRNQSRGVRDPGRVLVAALVGAVATLGVPDAFGAMPDLGALEEASQVQDDRLSQMRGRYRERGRIVQFGVRMVSQWQTTSGQVYRGASTIQVDVSSGQPRLTVFEPTASISRDSTSGTEPTDTGDPVRIEDQGTGNARGVVQAIQAGGDQNSVENDVAIDIRSAAARDGDTGQAVSGGQAQATASGSRVTVETGDRGVAVAIDIPGHGNLRQSIESGRGILQRAQVQSRGNRIRNHLDLGVLREALGSRRGISGGELKRAVQSLRDLGNGA